MCEKKLDEDMSSDCLAHARASAPGKLILFGEHAVVYGKTAVAAALSDLRVFISAVRIKFAASRRKPTLNAC